MESEFYSHSNILLWLACHERLPTKPLLLHRKIISDELCPLCKNELESLLHALCDCSLVRPLWLNIGSSLPPEFFSSLNLKEWLKKWSNSSLVTSFHSSILWKDVFPIFC